MKADILSVGTEILMGQIVNTNAQYIAQRLAELGIGVYYQLTVGDNHDRLKAAIADSLSRADIVILTGGLGPTEDDLTKETASELMGSGELEYDEASLEALKRRFYSMHREMTPNNLKQAMFPKECIILPNPNGTAPGCILERDGKAAILLPGPPREMIPMFNDSVMPYLREKSDCIFYSRVLRMIGIGESSLEYALKDMIDAQTNPTIAPYAKTGEVTLRITARCTNEAEGRALVEPTIEAIRAIVGDVIYSTDDEELHEVCAKLLSARGLKLKVAESCTGGMLASTLISVPGSSAWFSEGLVTYSNDSKTARLGVSPETLSRFGAVSARTACEMASGLFNSGDADVALSVTGIAGPDGGTADKPVGLVYVGVADKNGVSAHELKLNGSRERIRHTACLNAFDILRRRLLEHS